MKRPRLFVLLPTFLAILASCSTPFASSGDSSFAKESSASTSDVGDTFSSGEVASSSTDSSTASEEVKAKATLFLGEPTKGGTISLLGHSSGSEVDLGTRIEVVAAEESGYHLETLTVNDLDILKDRAFVCEEAIEYLVEGSFAQDETPDGDVATIALRDIPRGQNYALSRSNVVAEGVNVNDLTGSGLYNDDSYHNNEIRLGSGSTTGTLTFTFENETAIYQVKVLGRPYRDDSPSLRLSIDGSTLTNNYDQATFDFGGKTTKTMTIATTSKGERYIFTGFEIILEEGSYEPPLPIPATIQTYVNGDGTLELSPAGDWKTGDTLLVTATPAEGSYLSSLTFNGKSGTYVSSGTYSFLIKEENNLLEAVFRLKSGGSEDFSNLYANETIFPDRGDQAKDIDAYYESVRGLTGEALKDGLHDIIKGHTTFSYGSLGQKDWEKVDADPFNSNNFYVIYEGSKKKGYSVNKEHTWAKSHGGFGTTAPAGSDLHNLRGANSSLNSTRSNLDFGVVDHTSKNAIYGNFSWANADMQGNYRDDYFEPKDSWKGDVARIIFYMATRYDGGSEPELEVGGDIDRSRFNDFIAGASGLHGNFADLYEWATSGIDPVSDYEVNRNNLVDQLYQHNRNPFIDHPEFIVMIYDKSYDGPGALM